MTSQAETTAGAHTHTIPRRRRRRRRYNIYFLVLFLFVFSASAYKKEIVIPAREKNANKKDKKKKKKIFKFCCSFSLRHFHFHSGRVGAQESNVDTVSNVSSTGSHQVPKRNRRKNEAKKTKGMIETDRYIKERWGNKTKKSNGKKKETEEGRRKIHTPKLFGAAVENFSFSFWVFFFFSLEKKSRPRLVLMFELQGNFICV